MASFNNSQGLDSAPIPIHGQSGIFTLLLTVLCPLLLIIFIFLFFKFFFCHEATVLPNDTSDYTMNGTMQKNQHSGIDARECESISVELFEGETGTDAQCSICLGDLVDGNKVKVLPKCNHVFHPECIDMWLSSHLTCPLCRASLVSIPAEPCMIV